MPQTIVIESMEEFIERNGPSTNIRQSESDFDDGPWWICSNGARLNRSTNERQEPFDEGTVERLEGESRYLELRADEVQTTFVQLQNGLQEQCNIYVLNAGGMPSGEELNAVAELRALLSQTEKARDAKQAEYRELRGPSREEIRAEAHYKRKAEAKRFLDRMYASADRNPEQEQIQQEQADAKLSTILKNSTKSLNETSDRLDQEIRENELAKRANSH